MTLFIVGPVAQNDTAVCVECNAVLRIGQVLRREPKIERVASHHIESPARRERRSTALQCLAVELADKRNMAHRVIPACGAEIEVINGK